MAHIPNIRLLIYPALEVIFFCAAAYNLVHGHIIGAVLLCILSSIFLSYSVHIVFHEAVHRAEGATYNRLLAYLITILMGTPFDGYRIHHMNHHRYDNNFRDFSSTWRLTSNGIQPRNILGYCFGWPLHLAKMRKSIQFKHRKKFISSDVLRRIRQQKYVNMVTVLVLGIFAPLVLSMYIVTVYLGWSFVSLHNYLQHPPVASYKIHSYYSRLYNSLFSNNGLHLEHHTSPGVPWYLLQSRKKKEIAA